MQLAAKLPVSRVDRVHTCGARCQEHLSESAGGGADIESDTPVDIDTESRQRVRELRSATQRPLRADGDRRARADKRSGVGTGKAVDENLTTGDQRAKISQARMAVRGSATSVRSRGRL